MGNALDTSPRHRIGCIMGKEVTIVTVAGVGNFLEVEGKVGAISMAWLYGYKGVVEVNAMYKTGFWDCVRAALALQGYAPCT